MLSGSTLSIVFVVAGFITLACGIFVGIRQRAVIARSLATEGTVIELQRRRAEGEYVRTRTDAVTRLQPKYLYRPVVEFATPRGRRVRFVGGVAMRPAPYRIGARVPVLYDPDNPQRAQINRFVYLWFYMLMLMGFGTFFMAMGLLGYVLSVSS